LFDLAQTKWESTQPSSWLSSQNKTLGLSEKTHDALKHLFSQFDRKHLRICAEREEPDLSFYLPLNCEEASNQSSDGKIEYVWSIDPQHHFDWKDPSCISLKIGHIHTGSSRGGAGNYDEILECIVTKEFQKPICYIKHAVGNQYIDTQIDVDNPQIPEGVPLVPKLSFVGEVGKIGLGCISTLYFTYKAYKEVRSILKERKKKKEDPNLAETNNTAQSALSKQKKPSASPRKALGYTAAAVCSGAYTFFKWRHFDRSACLNPPWQSCTICFKPEDIEA
jgi:hypothetical protein